MSKPVEYEKMMEMFPGLKKEDASLVIRSARGPLSLCGPWVVFFGYSQEDDYAGVASFNTADEVEGTLNELTDELHACILGVYHNKKKVEVTRRWVMKE